MLFILLCELIGFSLEFTVGTSSRAVSKSGKRHSQTKCLSYNTQQVFEFTCDPPLHAYTLRHIHGHVKESNLTQHTTRSNLNHLFQTYMSSTKLSSLAKQSFLSYASGSAVPTSALSVSSLFYSHHKIYHRPLASPHFARPLVPPPHLGTVGCTPARAHRHPRRTAEVCLLWGC